MKKIPLSILQFGLLTLVLSILPTCTVHSQTSVNLKREAVPGPSISGKIEQSAWAFAGLPLLPEDEAADPQQGFKTDNDAVTLDVREVRVDAFDWFGNEATGIAQRQDYETTIDTAVGNSANKISDKALFIGSGHLHSYVSPPLFELGFLLAGSQTHPQSDSQYIVTPDIAGTDDVLITATFDIWVDPGFVSPDPVHSGYFRREVGNSWVEATFTGTGWQVKAHLENDAFGGGAAATDVDEFRPGFDLDINYTAKMLVDHDSSVNIKQESNVEIRTAATNGETGPLNDYKLIGFGNKGNVTAKIENN